MRRLLVTGGAGFIGSNFVRDAVRRGYDVAVLDKLTYASNVASIRDLLDSGKIDFVRGDVCDSLAVGKAIRGCDAVVHFAAETHVDRSVEEAGVFVRTDVQGTFVALEAARRANVDRFLHISTDEVYGESGARPCGEDAPLRPKSPYAASKAGADRLASSYFETHGVPVVIARCVNNYGPRQHPEKLIPLLTICALLDHRLPIYGTGRNRREWIHVQDHCDALFRLLRARNVDGETFNIGSGERRSTLQVARAVLRELGKPPSLITLVEDRPGHVRSHAVNSGKIRRVTGWTPLRSFDEGVPSVVEWYADHPEWWRRPILGAAKAYFRARYPALLAALIQMRGARRLGPVTR